MDKNHDVMDEVLTELRQEGLYVDSVKTVKKTKKGKKSKKIVEEVVEEVVEEPKKKKKVKTQWTSYMYNNNYNKLTERFITFKLINICKYNYRSSKMIKDKKKQQ